MKIKINFTWSFIWALVVIILIKLTKLFPELYFNFAGLYVLMEDVSIWAILIRILIPMLVGAFMELMMKDSVNEAYVTGFLGAFLLVWPTVVLPEIIFTEEFYLQRKMLYLIYLLMIISYTFLCAGGAVLVKYFKNQLKVETEWHEKSAKTFGPIIIGIITNILYDLLSKFI